MAKSVKRNKKLSIVIPVYNEKDLVIDVLKKVRKLSIPNLYLYIVATIIFCSASLIS